MATMTETIKFEFWFSAEFWDLKPMLDIAIDGQHTQSCTIDQKNYCTNFVAQLDLNKKHVLTIHRHNKNDSQCVVDQDGNRKDQFVIINRVTIDSIDVQNLLWSRSWYEPEYSESWKQQQIDQGIVLEQQVPGELWLSHNGIWYFEFTSPFYKFVIDQFN
jgi:hypothetical protein